MKTEQPATKTIKVRMTDTDGKVYFWAVSREPRAWACCLPLPQKPHYVSGWNFTDHEGCTRFVEGTWRDLLPRFQETATNYGFTSNLS